MSKNAAATRPFRIVSLAACGLLLASSVILARAPEVTGYEESIYTSMPFSFWLTTIAAFLLCLSALSVRATMSIRSTEPWALAAMAVVLIDVTLMLLPMLRGYYCYGREDQLSQIGWCLDVIQAGHYGSSDFYPFEHIFVANCVVVADVPLMDATMTVPAFFSLIYIFTSITLARYLFKGKGVYWGIVALLLIASMGRYNVEFSPYQQSFMMLPLFVLICLRRSDERAARFSLIAVVIIITLALFHPISALTAVVTLVVVSVSRRGGFRFIVNGSRESVKRWSPYYVALISITAFVAWSLYPLITSGAFERLADLVLGIEVSSEYESYRNLLLTTGTSPLYVLWLLALVYGQVLLFGVAGVIGTVRLATLGMLRQSGGRIGARLSGFGFMAFLTISTATLFFAAYTIPFTRLFVFCILFSSFIIPIWILAGNGLRLRIGPLRLDRKATLVTLVCAIAVLSVSNLHYSPFIKEANQQATETEFEGMHAFLQTRSTDITILEMGLSQERFYDALFGSDAPRENIEYGEETRPPTHFGYDDGTQFGDNINEPTYFITNILGQRYYEIMYPEYEDQWKFTTEDFAHLDGDSSVQLILSNGNVEAYLVLPT